MTALNAIRQAAAQSSYTCSVHNHGQRGMEVFLCKIGCVRKNHKTMKIELKGVDRTLVFNFAQRAIRPEGLYATSVALGDYRLNNFNGPLLSVDEIVAFIKSN